MSCMTYVIIMFGGLVVATLCTDRARKYSKLNVLTNKKCSGTEWSTLWSKTARSVMFCAYLCTEDDNCASFNYDSVQKICEASLYLHNTSCLNCQESQGNKQFARTEGVCTATSICNEGYTFYEDGQFYYKISCDPASWDDARGMCQAEGADLIVLKDNATFNYFRAIAKAKGHKIWVGGRFLSGGFRWIDLDGDIIVDNWGLGQPDGDGYCINFIVSKDFYLNDEYCSRKYHFMCAKET